MAKKKPRPGHKFALTELGFDLPKIRVKFDPMNPNREYEYSVPDTWIRNGYVREVRIDDGEVES